MGSSKIQERNLDPNMGLAKESSVQEVLNAVGNVAQQDDVQSILSAMGNVANKSDVNNLKNSLVESVSNSAFQVPVASAIVVDTQSSESNKYVTAVNYQGKGVFWGGLYFDRYASSNSGTTIIVDGNTIVNTYKTPTVGQYVCAGHTILQIPFEKSLVIKVAGKNSNISGDPDYYVGVYGHILTY